MPTPTEHKTVRARMLEHAETIGWTIVSREEAEQWRGFDPQMPYTDANSIAYGASWNLLLRNIFNGQDDEISKLGKSLTKVHLGSYQEREQRLGAQH